MSSFYSHSPLQELHVELTERCNAACPMCARTGREGAPNPHLVGAELTSADIAQMLPREFIYSLRRVRVCGNFGDPAVAHDALEICEYLAASNPALRLTFNTNGSVRGPDWWFELGRLFRGEGSAVQFALDGLADTHAVYRRGTRFPQILENAAAVIRAGGRAHWVFLVFSHNEHQVEDARALAAEMGFSQFTVKTTKRFMRNHGLSLRDSFPVFDRSGTELYRLRPATAHHNRALERIRTKLTEGHSAETLLHTVPIRCKATEDRSAYLSARGLLLPCCFVGSALYPAERSAEQSELAPLLEASGGIWQLDLRRHPPDLVVDSPFFQAISARWSVGCEGRLALCARVCGEGISAFVEQFHHTAIPSSDEEAVVRAF